MVPLAERLRDRARLLNLSNAEVARRAGLSERRYGNYVSGVREPDLATLMRICQVVGLTPNDLLLPAPPPAPADAAEVWISRLVSGARTLSVEDLQLAIKQIEALAAHRGAHPGSGGDS